MIKMENDIVIPTKPVFNRRYVDDIYNKRKDKRKVNIEDSLFKALNSYHENIKLTIEVNPIRFLEMHLHNKDGTYVAFEKKNIEKKTTKIPAHWSSQIPKRYRRNSVKVDLHRAEKFPLISKKRLDLLGINS